MSSGIKSVLVVAIVSASCSIFDSLGNKAKYAEILDPHLNKSDKKTMMNILGPHDTTGNLWEYQFIITRDNGPFEKEPGSIQSAYPKKEFEVVHLFFKNNIFVDWEYWSYRSID